MKFDLTFGNLLDNKILGQRGQQALREFYDMVVKLSDDNPLKVAEDFVDTMYEDDGDAFLDAILYDWEEAEKMLKEYLGVEESRKRRRESIRRKIKGEAAISGKAEDWIADNIEILIRNEKPLYRSMMAIVDSLVKKKKRGVTLDKDVLMKSSVVDDLVRKAIRVLQKEDHEGDNEGYFDSISTATRNLAKKMVADTIMDQVEDKIRFEK